MAPKPDVAETRVPVADHHGDKGWGLVGSRGARTLNKPQRKLQMAAEYAEQYLLFDHTEYIKGISHIGQVALIELIGTEPIEATPVEITGNFFAPPPMADGTLKQTEVCEGTLF